MEDILHQFEGSFPHVWQGCIHPRWCRISSIKKRIPKLHQSYFDLLQYSLILGLPKHSQWMIFSKRWWIMVVQVKRRLVAQYCHHFFSEPPYPKLPWMTLGKKHPNSKETVTTTRMCFSWKNPEPWPWLLQSCWPNGPFRKGGRNFHTKVEGNKWCV